MSISRLLGLSADRLNAFTAVANLALTFGLLVFAGAQVWLMRRAEGTRQMERAENEDRERAELASVIAEELRAALTYVVNLEAVTRQLQEIQPEFHAPVEAYEALVDRLGRLPTSTLNQVLTLYRQLLELNRVAMLPPQPNGVPAFLGLLEVVKVRTPAVVRALDGLSRRIGSPESGNELPKRAS